MTTTDQARDDLAFVADAVRRSDRADALPTIYVLWAAIIAIGFALPDFAPRWAGWYWLLVGPAGGLVSAWLGVRHGIRTGINDRELGRRYTLTTRSPPWPCSSFSSRLSRAR
ncbi:MAG TPA: hypothetical protein VNE58_08255 [Casimicrobiaceae bacterium]|nr:hypothetical protein [Casimicrobiaceae bacterium]